MSQPIDPDLAMEIAERLRDGTMIYHRSDDGRSQLRIYWPDSHMGPALTPLDADEVERLVAAGWRTARYHEGVGWKVDK